MILLWVAAGLLVIAGAAKVTDPSRTVVALRQLGWPSSPLLVRAGALGELVLGSATLTFGGPALALLVAASYLGFTVFVATALWSGKPIGSCGCIGGRLDTRPSGLHLVFTLTLAVGSAWTAVA